MMERERNEAVYFTNEIVMNTYTIREISFSLWKYKAGRNKWPVAIYLLAVFIPVVCALVTGNEDYMFLMGVIGLVGMAALFVYISVTAYVAAKKREKTLRQTIEKYGKAAVLTIDFGDCIAYRIGSTEKTVAYSEIEKIIELEMYLILQLKNGLNLPVSKLAFTHDAWNAFIPYLKQKTGKK